MEISATLTKMNPNTLGDVKLCIKTAKVEIHELCSENRTGKGVPLYLVCREIKMSVWKQIQAYLPDIQYDDFQAIWSLL